MTTWSYASTGGCSSMARATAVGSVSGAAFSVSPAIAARASPIHSSTLRVSLASPVFRFASAASPTSASPPNDSGWSRKCGQDR